MQIKQSILQTFDQLDHLLHQLTNEQYCQPLEILSGETIGKHVRHIVEFFQCLIIASDTICYDDRKREIQIENSISYTLNEIQVIKQAINRIDPNYQLKIKQFVAGETLIFTTTRGRELIYCIDHSIHHFAIIKLAIEQTYPEILIDHSFGIAYSTLKYQAQH